ncbi:sulfotransferase family 2 domain-containing protein [Paracoccus suum]|nr:sulfotransferase family 2 domain-containing protein [Paracoccus suum]
MSQMTSGAERAARMQALLRTPKSFDNTIHLSPDLGFMFFSNPIVACSTLKATLNQATARALGLPAPELRLDAIHDRAANPLQRPSDIGLPRFAEMLEDPAVRKIAFIRDPLRRFMSCFGKKLSKENRITERVRAQMKVPERIPLRDFLTPDSFATALESDPKLLNMNDHWRPQRLQVFYDLVPDLQIGRVETLKADVERMLTPIFGAGGYELIDVPALFPQNSSRQRAGGVPALSEDGLATVRRVYSGDFDMLAEVEARAPAAPVMPASTPVRTQPDPARPELIVHVGMPGNGGALIAASLAAADLEADHALDLGPSPLLARGKPLEAALDQSPAQLTKLGAGWAAKLASQAQAPGALRLILSNDRLCRHPQAMARLLEPLAERFDLRVVIFARDPHAWLAANAIGAPHPGALDQLVQRYGDLPVWQDLLPGAVEIHTCRGDTDMVALAAAVFGVTLPPVPEVADPESAIVAALLPDEGDLPSLPQIMQSIPSRAQIEAAIAARVGIFDAIAEQGGPDLLALAEPPPPAPRIEAVRARLLDALAARTAAQSARIAALEQRLAALDPAAPRRRKT